VSRLTIKKFAEEKYNVDVSGVNLSQLNRAIASGTEGGLFYLPKGPSGKVKLAPKVKASASKEVGCLLFD
jgi:histone H1/5